MYSYGPPHMAKQKQDDQLEHIYIQQLCEDTGCSPKDLPDAMNDREKWRERVRDIRASSTTWWWWLMFWMKTCMQYSEQTRKLIHTKIQHACCSHQKKKIINKHTFLLIFLRNGVKKNCFYTFGSLDHRYNLHLLISSWICWYR